MSINLELPRLTELKPRIVVIGVGGAGGNAINNMIASGLTGVDYIAANTDAQALVASSAERRIQLGINLTEGLGAGSKPEIGEAAAEEAIDEIRSHVAGAHMVFIAAGMGGGTGTGAAAVIARAARDMGVLTVGIVTKPFQFEGTRRLRTAEAGIAELRKYVDTLIVIPNQNLFRVATERTTFAEAFVLADQVLYSGVACIVDLIVKDGLINLDFADVRTVMSGMGTAMMGTGEATGDGRALRAAEEAITNPLLDEVTLRGAKGVLLSIIGGRDMTLYEVDEAASRVRQEVDPEANIIVGATFDEQLGDNIRVAIVASGLSLAQQQKAATPPAPAAQAMAHGPLPPPLSASQATPPLPPRHGVPASQAFGPSVAVAPSNAFVAGTPPSSPPRRPDGAENPGFDAAYDATPPRELWRGPGNVVIEETRPPRPQYEAVRHNPGQRPGESYPSGSFRPAPPEDVRRPPSRRIPELDEFPPVGQREFRAKSETGGAAARATNQTESTPRGGLLQRMLGSGRNNEPPFADGDQEAASQSGHRFASFFNRNRG